MDALLLDAHRRASHYLSTLDKRAVRADPDAVARLRAALGKLPERPHAPQDVLSLLDSAAGPATVASAGGRYFGFVTGGSHPAPHAAHVLATAWDQNAFSFVSSPAAAIIEDVTLAWLVDALHLGPNMAGGFTTGATMANLSCLAAARHRILRNQAWDVERDGLGGAPPVRLIVGEEVHPTILKGLGILGLGRGRVERVSVDAQGRLRADALPHLDSSCILILQAGNVNSGAFDPIDECARRAREAGAWTHVDGAFGLWAAASPQFAHLVKGLDRVDSCATDAHKWLNVPYDSGVAFVRDAQALRSAMSFSAAYLPPSDEREPGQFTPESSRRARGVDVYAALASLGRSGVADLVERCCRHARRFAAGLQEAGFEVLNEVVLNQVVVSFGSAERTRAVIARVQEEGTCWAGPTEWRGRVGMRISVSSWRTSDQDVERSLDAIIRCAREA